MDFDGIRHTLLDGIWLLIENVLKFGQRFFCNEYITCGTYTFTGTGRSTDEILRIESKQKSNCLDKMDYIGALILESYNSLELCLSL